MTTHELTEHGKDVIARVVGEPNTIEGKATGEIWRVAAEKLGWKWEPAYAGYIHPAHHPNGPGNEFASYPSDVCAEEACMLDGIETLTEAVRFVTDGVRP